jgi:hypothetical protein
LKFDKCFLNNISRLFPVAGYAAGVLKKRDLKTVQDLLKVFWFASCSASHRF